jgi:hypothetical protein
VTVLRRSPASRRSLGSASASTEPNSVRSWFEPACLAATITLLACLLASTLQLG